MASSNSTPRFIVTNHKTTLPLRPCSTQQLQFIRVEIQSWHSLHTKPPLLPSLTNKLQAIFPKPAKAHQNPTPHLSHPQQKPTSHSKRKGIPQQKLRTTSKPAGEKTKQNKQNPPFAFSPPFSRKQKDQKEAPTPKNPPRGIIAPASHPRHLNAHPVKHFTKNSHVSNQSSKLGKKAIQRLRGSPQAGDGATSNK